MLHQSKGGNPLTPLKLILNHKNQAHAYQLQPPTHPHAHTDKDRDRDRDREMITAVCQSNGNNWRKRKCSNYGMEQNLSPYSSGLALNGKTENLFNNNKGKKNDIN